MQTTIVRAYVSIVFDNCFVVGEIRVMQGPTGLFVSFPAKKQRDGTMGSLLIRPHE
jgi:stage V sporulation protein G